MNFCERNSPFFPSQMSSASLITELSQITPGKYLFWYLLVLGLGISNYPLKDIFIILVL